MDRMVAIVAAVALCVVPLSAEARHRLPAGAKWGRCLLVVEGRTRISGRCSYTISAEGKFHIDGSRQVFDGIDYPKAAGMAMMMSTDYWADVFRDGSGWTGYGNTDIRSVHGEGDWGPLRQVGACFIGRAVRVCRWRK